MFSDLKRMFGETVTARSIQGAMREIAAKIDDFNDYKRIRAGIMKVSGNGVVLA